MTRKPIPWESGPISPPEALHGMDAVTWYR
jgi:hypothetical protein